MGAEGGWGGEDGNDTSKYREPDYTITSQVAVESLPQLLNSKRASETSRGSDHMKRQLCQANRSIAFHTMA